MPDAPAFPDRCDLGDGLAAFQAGQSVFKLDLVGFVRWYADLTDAKGVQGYAVLDAVKEKVRADCSVSLNDSQADSLLDAAFAQVAEIKKKRLGSQGSPPSTASTA